MRLIDADETIKELNDKITRLDARQQIYMENGLIAMADTMARKIELCIECRELLEHQPTAYDVDKVVEQLGKKQNNKGFGGTIQEIFYDLGLEDAIEIVKGGGIDGNTNT
ncbi:hypothetical protein [Eubacterium sp.]|uniref:hypothetical protein n=1 Tax=Eubacterium sp. TaxID=142586 RepID=UPI00352156E4